MRFSGHPSSRNSSSFLSHSCCHSLSSLAVRKLKTFLPSCGLFEFFCLVIFSSSVLQHFGASLLKCLSRCGLWEHSTITSNEKLEEFLSAEHCWTLILHFFIVSGCDCGLIDGGHHRSACLKSCIVLVSGESEHYHFDMNENICHRNKMIC